MTLGEMILEAIRKDTDVDFVGVEVDSNLVKLLVLARWYIWSGRPLHNMALRLLQKRRRVNVSLTCVLLYLAHVIGRTL